MIYDQLNVCRFNTMSKLSKLYELRRLSQEFGMEWTEKQERQLEAEEEHLIKNEVLPVVSKIEERTAWESLQKFILGVGVAKVRAIGLIANKIPLVSNTVDKKYKTAQKPLGNGWLLMTCSDTATKRKQILAIASHLGLNVNVEII